MNLQRLDSKSSVLPIELPGKISKVSRRDCNAEDLGQNRTGQRRPSERHLQREPVARRLRRASLVPLMGSLIKKRRKRMRKKKHRKLLKRTRVQRRNKK